MEPFNIYWNYGYTSKKQQMKSEKVASCKHRKQVVNLSSAITAVCEERHAQYLKNTSNVEKRETYRDKNKQLKKALRTHKRK